MAIDIRATVTCSLGTLISASLSDDYLQGTGLVKCKGSVEITGVITPAIGTAVTFSYIKGGVTRSVPRKLRVLSSFADPFRRTTKVELGCKLTYLSDLKEAVNWTAFDDPQNAGYTAADAAVITLPISASSVMDKCLDQLGLTASSNPLTNKFSVAKFDFGPGYVQVLSDLLVSESYCGYLDEAEVLQVVSLSAEGGTGPVIDSSSIIDLGPIGIGQLPGEAVTVSYSTLRLKQPDANAEPLWDRVATSNSYVLPISYTSGGSQATAVFNVLETTETENSYTYITTTAGERQRVLSSRQTIESSSSAAIVGGLATEYLSNGIGFNNQTVRKLTTETFAYDADGNETFYSRDVLGPAPYLHGTAGVPWVFSSSDYVTLSYGSDLPIERELRYTSVAGEFQQVQTLLYGPWAKTIAGQQSIANARESFTTASEVSAYLNTAYDTATGLQLIDSRISTEQRSLPQQAPDQADVINARYANGGNASNGYRIDGKASLELALGSAAAQRRTELSLPYAPDDSFYKEGSTYGATASDAPAKASLYGRVQNKLLLGNRNGMNLQLAPETVPAAPFAPFVVQANGLSGLYRNNGTSWTMDANGIVVSTDALFWGAVGGTGAFWFPVAPGITELPTTPAVVDGQMTVTSVVPVWNETLVANASTRVTLQVQSLNYALAALTEVPAQSVKISFEGVRFTRVSAPTTTLSVAAVTPTIYSGGSAKVPLSSISIAAPRPDVVSGGSAVVPISNFIMTAPEPLDAGKVKTLVPISTTDLLLLGITPAVVSGGSVNPPVSNVALAILKPAINNAIVVGTAAPELGAGAATVFTGWTKIYDGNADDASILFNNFGFTFTLASNGYTNCYIGSNGYVTFGGGSSAYSSLSASNPPLPKIMFAPGDRSYQRVYTKTGTLGSLKYAAFRWEGSSGASGTAGSPNIVAEVRLFSQKAGEQWVEVRFGNNVSPNSDFMIANSSTAYVTGTSAANSSWVFVGNSTGTSWTLASNRYVI